MKVELNEDQVEIARQARRFFENECSMEFVRRMYEDDRGFTDELWGKMVEMGWTAMLLPEAYGGLDMELMDLCVVLEEMGRAVVPGPLFSTVLLAAEAIKAAGNEAQKEKYLSAIASGELRGTLALSEPDSHADLDYIQMEAKADGDGFLLDGIKLFVPDAASADFIVLAARTKPGSDAAGGVTLFLLDVGTAGLTVSPLPVMDGTRRQCAVECKNVRVGPDQVLGRVNQGWSCLSGVLRRAQVGLCAENVGGADRSMEIATQYAKERVQFELPIGSYQAIKHKCAQMFLEVESARSIMYMAAWAQDRGDPKEAALAASAAKAYTSENFRNVACAAVQVLGGTGFTWEHDLHLFLKRAKANEVALGDPVYHREEVVRIIEGEIAV
ncbi:MAG: acyl-CoA/acyl-ACP dehydrogenase [Proteobacteria bacterium]|nr:acyl-CoA/acyl-ACP dehydrogenase [Pseudomonadota bacterium]